MSNRTDSVNFCHAMRKDGLVYMAMSPWVARVIHSMMGDVEDTGQIREATDAIWEALIQPLWYTDEGKDVWKKVDIVQDVSIRVHPQATNQKWLTEPLPGRE